MERRNFWVCLSFSAPKSSLVSDKSPVCEAALPVKVVVRDLCGFSSPGLREFTAAVPEQLPQVSTASKEDEL